MEKLRDWLKYLLPFLIAVLIFSFVNEYEQTITMLSRVFGGLWYMMTRFAIGFGMAYFLNFPVRFFECRLKVRRWLSITLVYVLLLGFLALMGWIIIPSVADSAKSISTSINTYYNSVMELLNGLMVNLTPETQEVVDDTIRQITAATIGYMKQLLTLSTVGVTIGNLSRGLTNIGFGLLISVYAIWDKEKLAEGAKRILHAFAKPDTVDFVARLADDADKNFSQFIIGKTIDSVIIGVLAIILFLSFGLPVAPFLAMVVMVTNMVPYFGPLVGGIICGVVLMGFSPMSCLVGVLIIIGLQCLDGAVIGPKILGDAVGISPLLTVISITIGGDLFGLAGIFFAVPVVGTLKNVVVSKILDARLARKEEEEHADDGQSELDVQVNMESSSEE